jgi:hypothetical protein
LGFVWDYQDYDLATVRNRKIHTSSAVWGTPDKLIVQQAWEKATAQFSTEKFSLPSYAAAWCADTDSSSEELVTFVKKRKTLKYVDDRAKEAESSENSIVESDGLEIHDAGISLSDSSLDE